MSTYAQLRLAAEAYAVPIGNVVEIAILGDLTTVPGARPEILGVRNLRGQILPVVDLALLLGINAITRPDRLLVAEAGGRHAGFAVDAVSEVGELPDPTEETESDLLTGATLVGGDFIGIIDVTRVFDSLEGRGSERSGR